ncbi:MAG: hypothetical protein GXO31_02460 [Epsilonproteobacteria bacterium]|nr:hypothetical protein [Campylobacterota bacterium]
MNRCYKKIKLFIDSKVDESQFFQNIFILTLIQNNNRFIEKIVKNNFYKYCKKILSEAEIEKIYEKTKDSLLKENIITEDLTLKLCANGESFDSLNDYEIYDLIDFCEEKIDSYLQTKALVAA